MKSFLDQNFLLNSQTTIHLYHNYAEDVWNICNEKLNEDSMSVRNIIKKSKVTHICTTDDTVDSLEWHKHIADDASFFVKVYPAWRSDKAMNKS